MSYQFDIESDSEDTCDNGAYNSRTVVVGGGRVNYVKSTSTTKLSPRKRQVATAEENDDDEYTNTKPDRMRPVSLPIDRPITIAQSPNPEHTSLPMYNFKKIPWQLPKTPVTPAVVNIETVNLTTRGSEGSGGDYTVVSPKYPPPREDGPGTNSYSNRRTHSHNNSHNVSRPVQSGDKKNTRSCQFVKFEIVVDQSGVKSVVVVENKCKNGACNFAHTIDVYNPPGCIYQDSCKNGKDTCKFFHSKNESKVDYYIRSSMFPDTRTTFHK